MPIRTSSSSSTSRIVARAAALGSGVLIQAPRRWPPRSRLAARSPPCPFAGLTIEVENAAELRGEAVDHRQAEAGALADALGREEGLDRAGERLLVHADAGVAHGDADIIAGTQTGSVLGRSTASALIDSVPPRGMASRALIARLRIASSSWLGSTRAGGSSGCSD